MFVLSASQRSSLGVFRKAARHSDLTDEEDHTEYLLKSNYSWVLYNLDGNIDRKLIISYQSAECLAQIWIPENLNAV